MRVATASRWRHRTAVWVGGARIGSTGRAAVRTVLGHSDDNPFGCLVFQVVFEIHGRSIGLALQGNRHRGVGLLALVVDCSNLNVHRSHVEFGLLEMIDHTLTHRVIVICSAVLTAGETEGQKEGVNQTHYSIIPGVDGIFVPRSIWTSHKFKLAKFAIGAWSPYRPSCRGVRTAASASIRPAGSANRWRFSGWRCSC